MKHLIRVAVAFGSILASGCATPPASQAGAAKVVKASRPAFQGISVPSFPGWQATQYLKPNGYVDSLTLRKTVGSNRLQVRFAVSNSNLDIPNKKPDGIKELRDNAKLSNDLLSQADPTRKVLEQKETTFRGFPAIETKTQSRNRDKTISQTRDLRVADGKRTFWISRSVSGNPISPDALQQADNAFDQLSKGLKFP